MHKKNVDAQTNDDTMAKVHTKNIDGKMNIDPNRMSDTPNQNLAQKTFDTSGTSYR